MSDLRLAPGVDLRAHIDAWVGSPELAELVSAFDGTVPIGDASAVLAELDSFSDRWDFRGGKDRNQTDSVLFDDHQNDVVDRAARALGQHDRKLPESRRWDRVVVLGGLLRACIARPAALADAMATDSDMSVGTISALGAFRTLNEPERSMAKRRLEWVPADELDAMQVGVRRAFGLDGAFDVRGEQLAAAKMSWEERVYRTEDEPAFEILAAPAATPAGRTDTPRILEWLADTRPPDEGDAILVVTTEIYRHYHLVEAIRILALPFGATVDALGMSPGDVDPALAHEFEPYQRVQEIRSSIRALRSLVAALG